MSESESTRQANNVIPPTSSAVPGTGVTSLSSSTTAASRDMYDAVGNPYVGLFDRYLTLCANGGDIYVSFSPAAVTVDQTVAGATVAAGTTTVVPFILKDGVPMHVRLNRIDHRFLNLKAATGTPSLLMYPSSQKSPGNP